MTLLSVGRLRRLFISRAPVARDQLQCKRFAPNNDDRLTTVVAAVAATAAVTAAVVVGDTADNTANPPTADNRAAD